MNKEEKKNKENELDHLYNQSLSEGGNIESEGLMADFEDFTDETYDEHDYDGEMEEIYSDSKEVVGNMSALYLDDNEELLDNSYIKKKIENDAENLSDIKFLQNITKTAIVKQMKQIEQGDVTPRHFETLYGGMKEMRENIKQSTTTINTMEGFYKQLRDDLGLKDNIGSDLEIEEGSAENNNVIDQKSLNARLDEIIKKNKEGDDD
jgi:hypothetical protein